MEISIQLVLSMVLGVVALMIILFMANTHLSGAEQTLTGWVP